MNALNIGSTPEVIPAPPPLVVDLRGGKYAWVERGYGFTLDVRGSGVWIAIVGELRGGTVLKPSQVAALVATFGKPVLP